MKDSLKTDGDAGKIKEFEDTVIEACRMTQQGNLAGEGWGYQKGDSTAAVNRYDSSEETISTASRTGQSVAIPRERGDNAPLNVGLLAMGLQLQRTKRPAAG